MLLQLQLPFLSARSGSSGNRLSRLGVLVRLECTQYRLTLGPICCRLDGDDPRDTKARKDSRHKAMLWSDETRAGMGATCVQNNTSSPSSTLACCILHSCWLYSARPGSLLRPLLVGLISQGSYSIRQFYFPSNIDNV